METLDYTIEHDTHLIHYCINESKIELILKLIHALKELRG